MQNAQNSTRSLVFLCGQLCVNVSCQCLESWMCFVQTDRKDFLTHGSYDITRILAYLEEEHSVWASSRSNHPHDWSFYAPPPCTFSPLIFVWNDSFDCMILFFNPLTSLFACEWLDKKSLMNSNNIMSSKT